MPAPKIARCTTNWSAVQPGCRAAGSSKKSQPTDFGLFPTIQRAASSVRPGDSLKYFWVPMCLCDQSVRRSRMSPGQMDSPEASSFAFAPSRSATSRICIASVGVRSRTTALPITRSSTTSSMASPSSILCRALSTCVPVCRLIRSSCVDIQNPGSDFVLTFICTPRSVEGGPLKPWGTAGLRSTIFATKRRSLLRVERHVELALAALKQWYRRAEAELLEVFGLAVRLVGILVHVLLVEVEQVGVLRVAVGLVEQISRLLPGERRELPYALLDLVRFALFGRPLRNNNECHT